MTDVEHPGPKARFHPTGRQATQPPKPGYPEGLVVDTAADTDIQCAVDLQYPADCIGMWEVRCKTCGISLSLTAAGRTDDPRRVVVGCGLHPTAMTTKSRAWTKDQDGQPNDNS